MSLTTVKQEHQAADHMEKALWPTSSIIVLSDKHGTDHQAERDQLLSSLRGRTIRIPDLVSLFKHWPTKSSPDLDRLRLHVREWLNSTTPPGKVLDNLQISDFGSFGAAWWPCATFDKLVIVTYLSIWLFTWDDEIDCADGSMCDEFGTAQLFRDQTLSYVRHSLGLDTRPLDPAITNRIILNFAPIGEALRESYTVEQREMVYDTMKFFMNMSEHEQRLRLSGAIPSVEDFWRYRLGSSAVPVCLAFNEFSWEGMNLPPDFHRNEHVKRIERCTNTVISTVNDLLSLKKEIRYGGIDSLVPIYLYHVGDLDTAVKEIMAFLTAEINSVDEAAALLFQQYKTANQDVQRQVKNFVDGCKHYSTGNLIWSLETGRYGVETVDGEIVMTL